MGVVVVLVVLAVVVLLAAVLLRRRRSHRRRARTTGGAVALSPPADGAARAAPGEELQAVPVVPADAAVDEPADEPPVVSVFEGDEAEDPAPEPGADDPTGDRLAGRRIRVPFASPLSARLGPPTEPAAAGPDGLLTLFQRTEERTATDQVVVALGALGYEPRWRRPGEVALGGPGGRVALVTTRPTTSGAASITVELEPGELADAAVHVVHALAGAGYLVERRVAGGLVLQGDGGDEVRLLRTEPSTTS